jgi:arabinose-5-phosphate isomerase
MTIKDYAIQCIKDEAQAVLNLIPQTDDNFDRAVELMLNCKGKVIVTGVGKSGHIGAKIAATLASTGTPSFFINPLDVFHGDLGVMSKGDVVIAISYSGQTDELLRFIPMVLHMEIPIIGISGNPQSLLAKYSTCHLNVSVEKEACPLNLAPTSSTTATLVMGDALAGLCTVPSRRRVRQATAHHGTRRDADRQPAATDRGHAPGQGYHPGQQRQAGLGSSHRKR